MSPFFIALVLVDVLLLALLVALPVRIAWWSKVIAIVVVLGFNFLAWDAGGSGQGWPVGQALPANAQYVACLVIEPNKTEHITGAIYVWVVPLNFKHGVLSYRPNVGEPRAYHEPYDRSLHEACIAAEKEARRGTPVGIRRRGTGPHGHGRGRFMPYVLPSINLPRKDGS